MCRYYSGVVSMFILTMLSLASCESDVKLEIPSGGGQLVVFSFLCADSTMKVHLSKSVSHSSVDDFERVYDGYVIVKLNGMELDSVAFPFDKTYLELPSVAVRQGDRFEIEGGTLSGLRAEGHTRIPYAPQLIGVDSITETITDNILSVNYEVEFADPRDEANYYQLVITSEVRDADNKIKEFYNVNFFKDDELFYIRDQEGSLLGGIDFLGSFSDYIITEERYRIKVRVPSFYLATPGENERRIVRFHLLSLSEDYYKYLRSRVVAEYSYDLPIVDPIKIHSNIIGGLGLVGGMTFASDSVVYIGNDYN